MHKYRAFWVFLLISMMTSAYGGDDDACDRPGKRVKVSNALRGESNVTGDSAEQDQENRPLKRTAEKFLGSPGKRHEALKESPQDTHFPQPTGSITTMLTFYGPSLEALDDYVLWEIVKHLPFSEIAQIRTLSKSVRGKIDGIFMYLNQQKNYISHDAWREEWKLPMVVFRFQDLYRVGNLCSEAMYLNGDAQVARELDRIILMLPEGLNLRENLEKLQEESSAYVNFSAEPYKEAVSVMPTLDNTDFCLRVEGIEVLPCLMAPFDGYVNQSSLGVFDNSKQDPSLSQVPFLFGSYEEI